MNMKIIFPIFLIVSISFLNANKHATQSKFMSYKGLVMVGYQGWFRVFKHGMLYPDETKVRIDMWPDVSEYKKTYPTGLKHADGSTARFLNSTDKSTVDLHFKWMKEYGIDGVFMQCFFNSTKPSGPCSATTKALKNAFEAASKNERAIAVMYDLSGLKATGEVCSSILEDCRMPSNHNLWLTGLDNEYLKSDKDFLLNYPSV